MWKLSENKNKNLIIMAKEAVKESGAEAVDSGKLKALQATIDKIEKDFGKGTIMKLGDQPQWD